MYAISRLFVASCLGFVILCCVETIPGQSSHHPVEVHKIYVGTFGSDPGAVYLRNRLLKRLARSGTTVIVSSPTNADAVLTGSAALRLLGYWNSNPRVRYRNSSSVAVYDANMTVQLEDGRGRLLWSGNLKPRFWGSQYVSDNVVNQAVRHVIDALRDNERNSPPDC